MCVCVSVYVYVCAYTQKGDVSYTAFRLYGVPADWPNNPLKGDDCNYHHCNGSVCVFPL